MMLTMMMDDYCITTVVNTVCKDFSIKRQGRNGKEGSAKLPEAGGILCCFVLLCLPLLSSALLENLVCFIIWLNVGIEAVVSVQAIL